MCKWYFQEERRHDLVPRSTCIFKGQSQGLQCYKGESIARRQVREVIFRVDSNTATRLSKYLIPSITAPLLVNSSGSLVLTFKVTRGACITRSSACTIAYLPSYHQSLIPLGNLARYSPFLNLIPVLGAVLGIASIGLGGCLLVTI